MARPNLVPTWATDATLTSGPETGQTTRFQPSDALRAQGVPADRRIAGRVLSWMFGMIGDWLGYLDQQALARQAQNWPERFTLSSNASATNANLAACWAPQSGYRFGNVWVILDALKNCYSSQDGQIWTSVQNLTKLSQTKPEIALGKVDGTDSFMTGGSDGSSSTGDHYTSNADTTSFTFRQIGVGVTMFSWVPCYSSSLNRWVALGVSGYYCSGTTTAGALVWSFATVPSAWTTNSGGVKRLLWNGSVFVATAVNSYNKVLTSSDGITWTERTIGATGSWTGLAWSATDSLWYIVGNGLYSSPDGITWTFVTSSLPAANDLACNGPVLVLSCNLGSFGGVAYSTNKGVTWNNLAVGKHDLATAGYPRLVYGDRFFALHATGSVIEMAMSLRG